MTITKIYKEVTHHGKVYVASLYYDALNPIFMKAYCRRKDAEKALNKHLEAERRRKAYGPFPRKIVVAQGENQ